MVEHDIVQHLSEGDVALLKGDGWEGNEGLGVIHRSRLLMTMKHGYCLRSILFKFYCCVMNLSILKCISVIDTQIAIYNL